MDEMVPVLLIVLILATTVLAIFAVLARVLEDRRERRRQSVSERLLDSVQRCIAGTLPAARCARELRRRPELALDVLVLATERHPESRPTLHLLLDASGLGGREQRKLTHSGDRAARLRAAERLRQLRDPRSREPLTAALADPVLDVRLAAARALTALDAHEATTQILGALALPGSWPLERAAEILVEGGPRTGRVLQEQLELDTLGPHAAVVAIRVLGLLRARGAVTELERRIASQDLEQRIASARSLGQLALPSAAGALVAALDDVAWEVRNAAARSLGQLCARDALPALARCLADPAWWVRLNAAEAILRIGGADALAAAGLGHADRYARDITRQVLEEHGVTVSALAA